VYWEIQKLVAFLVVFLGAYQCQILMEMNMASLVSFAFLDHCLIQKLQDLERIKKCSTKIFDFPDTHKKSLLVHFLTTSYRVEIALYTPIQDLELN